MKTENNDTELTGIREIARRAQVSIATVDRVIHKRTGVSMKTRDKINRIISDLNYQPNLLARRLASRKVIRIATLIPGVSPDTSFWEAPLQGIEQAENELKQYGISIEKVFFNHDDVNTFVKQAAKVLKSKPDGVLIAPSFAEQAKPFLDECKKLRIPFVFINSDVPGKDCLCYIGPDLYQSGYLAGNLVSYLIDKDDEVLLLHISRERENLDHLLRKEEGFRAYFKERHVANRIIRREISPENNHTVPDIIHNVLKENKNIRLIFVTNSRVSSVAPHVNVNGKKILLIGYDYLRENLNYLDKGMIDFLICQKPVDQAYSGVMALYKHLVLSVPVEKINYSPIDIITRENYKYYRN